MSDLPRPFPDPPKPSGSNNRWFLYLGGIIVVWAILMVVLTPRGKPGLQPPVFEKPKMNMLAPERWTLQDINGEPVEFSSFRGKTIFINFWATWCPPCLEELPSIEKLAANERLKNVVFLGISKDEDVDALKRFVKEKNPKFRVLRPQGGGTPSMFATDGIPATFIVGPSGLIEFGLVGSADWNSPEVIDALAKLSGVK